MSFNYTISVRLNSVPQHEKVVAVIPRSLSPAANMISKLHSKLF